MALTPSLRERVLTAARRVRGAPERDHMLVLLRDAEGFRLEPAAARAVADALRAAPERVESNLDLVRLSGRGIWIEYPDAARRLPGVAPLPGSRHPVDVGVLVTVDPDDEDRFVILAAWDFAEADGFGDGDAAGMGRRGASVRHAYAAVALSRGDVSRHAYAARGGILGAPEGAPERMLGLVHAYIPPGFAAELHVATEAADDEARDAAETEAMRDAVSEATFALAALLFLSSRGADVARGPEGGLRTARLRAGALTPLGRYLFGDGFRREGDPRRPRLAFRPSQTAAA